MQRVKQGYRYRPKSTLPIAEIDLFERTYGLRLPQGYRDFIATVGNGDEGENCGLLSLEESVAEIGVILGHDVDLKKYFGLPFKPLHRWGELKDLPVPLSGLLPISRVDNCYQMLAVNGDDVGTLWFLNGETHQLAPTQWPGQPDKDANSDAGSAALTSMYGEGYGRRLEFLEWYNDWLDHSIAKLPKDVLRNAFDLIK